MNCCHPRAALVAGHEPRTAQYSFTWTCGDCGATDSIRVAEEEFDVAPRRTLDLVLRDPAFPDSAWRFSVTLPFRTPRRAGHALAGSLSLCEEPGQLSLCGEAGALSEVNQ